jgi:hypothetical protein
MYLKAFKKKPKLAITWWAMVLGLLALLVFPLLGLYSLINKTLGAAELGPSVGITGIIITIAAVTTGAIAFKKGERSWVLWVGFGPALLLAAFWLFMIVAEIISAVFGLGF